MPKGVSDEEKQGLLVPSEPALSSSLDQHTVGIQRYENKSIPSKPETKREGGGEEKEKNDVSVCMWE